jgi:hypothetical protein
MVSRDKDCYTIESILIGSLVTIQIEASLNRNGLSPQKDDEVAGLSRSLIFS